ncbi:MAG: hypothetical protein CL916_11655 [Deltaproteobacteria bacterium]|nr:hypothetical protein [Deltaproteobacteria bacterium]
MNVIWAITKREIHSFFKTPIGWLCILGFSIINGVIFSWVVAAYSDPAAVRSGHVADINQQILPDYFGTLSVILLLLSPVISMRSFAEDRKQQSFTLLLSSPISSFSIVMGKFLGLAIFSLFLIATTLPCSILLVRYGEPNIAILAANYLANFLMLVSCCSLGMTISACTKNQLIAGTISFISILLLWFCSGIAPLLSNSFSDILSYISLLDHIGSMSKGLVQVKDIVYFLGFIVFFIFACTQRVERYRWQ